MRCRGRERQDAFQTMLKQMRPYFWDADTESLDADEHSSYIIARLLNMGGMPGYLWVKDLYDEEAIRRAVINRRDWHPIVRNFMAQQYNIPKEQLKTAPPWR